ncbi:MULTISPECIES: TetR/AcrR family transcriptional regulator [Arthrobacter]|uniref:TetR/AcrR family transcriptional regulator n=1 Tax=Arthrobacter terricola TaxID=2547396 RepID=A0A4V2ZSS0_9MICC|nr:MULTISPECIES: TetR family transcriptional regulator [Arthrobacter]MBT8161827.1 TetR family transcriptional regulator [Arthrobacter sp. GN70]TDF94214.1 TetR/AcrR family transcriptional regulator [Arthrobacter terricola]
MGQPSRKLQYGDGREALLAAVIDVVAEKGLRGVTYRAVAARAGVNHTLVTHHFGSIEGLLAATMEWAVQRSIQETGLAGIADFDEGFADSLMATVSAEPELQLFQFEMLLESRRNPKILPMVEGLYDTYVEAVEEALAQRGLDTSGEASRAIFAALDGLMLQFLTITSPAKVRSALIQVGRLVSGLPDTPGDTPNPAATESA